MVIVAGSYARNTSTPRRTMFLDVNKLPTKYVYPIPGGEALDLSRLVTSHRPAVEALAENELIERNNSFGLALAGPFIGQTSQLPCSEWDNPYIFTSLIHGWGEEGGRYCANAARKLRALLRTGASSTLELRLQRPHLFQNRVESVDEAGHFPWGDFPWGGAVTVRKGPLALCVAVSCLHEEEDEAVATLIGGIIVGRLLRTLDVLGS